jgi:hypothetical protein
LRLLTALETWERLPSGELDHISRYKAAQKLMITHAVLTGWIKRKDKILYQKQGRCRLRVKNQGKEPVMEKKLNLEFEDARSIGRVITYHWFTR